MHLLRAAIGGLIAGVIGAIIWAAIAYFAQIQLGIIAWAIGGMVGFGVAIAAKGHTGLQTGILAAVIALASIAGGKYFTILAIVGNGPTFSPCTDAEARAGIAHEVAEQFEHDGKKLAWPEGKNLDEAEELEDYPKDVAAEATKHWDAKSPEDQRAFKEQRDAQIKQAFSSFRSSFVSTAFMNSFTIFSVVFGIFAVITAFKLGSGMVTDSE